MSVYPRESHNLSPQIATILSTGFVYPDPQRQALYLLRRTAQVSQSELTSSDRALMAEWRQQTCQALAAD